MKKIVTVFLMLSLCISLLPCVAMGATAKSETRAPVNQDVFLSDVKGWPGYESIFDTPAFTGRGDDFTDNSTMISYLKSLLPTCSNMYYFTMGSSPTYKLEMPLVVFTKTDLTGMTMEEAAVAVRANGKATVLHQAQIHGNEPAAGEGALALAGALARGDLKDYAGGNILDSLNIMIIPRINPDGSYKFQRNNTANGINLNRDYLVVKSSEVEMVLEAYNAFLPDVVIDAHEWTPDKTSGTGVFDDLQLWAAGSLNNDSGLLDTSIDMMETAFAAAQEQGIRPYFYQGVMTFGAGSNSIGPWYYGLRGSLGFCVETRGIGIGWMNFERRVISQYFAAESIIQYTASHATQIRSRVEQERVRIAEVGETYEESDKLVLQHKSRSYGKAYSRPTISTYSNKVTNANATATPTIYDVAGRTRTRPTAYVLQSGTTNLKTVLATLDKHNIRYIQLEESLSLPVQQYSGSGSSASLGSEKTVTFRAGSYVFPMDQVGGNVLAMLMEPDVNDTASPSEALSTFVQKKTLSASAIYRYTGSLDLFAEDFAVTFCQEDGAVLEVATVKKGETAVFTGQTPTKDYTEEVHYVFSGWVNKDGSPAVLSDITEEATFYASFSTEVHSYSRQTDVEPTCTQNGTERYACVSCGRTYYESTDLLPHVSETVNGKEATCSTPGYTGDEVCTVCNTILRRGQVIPTLPHSAVPVPGKEATCMSSGLSDGEICGVCGLTLIPQQVLPRLGHSYSYTDLENGNHRAICNRCERENTESHNYENGVCVCGATYIIEDSAIKINHTLNLASDISVNLVVSKSILAGFDMETVYILAEVETEREIKPMKLLPTEQGNYYYFTLEGLTAVNMTDRIRSVLYGIKDGQAYRSPIDDYSIADYAYSQMKKTDSARSLKTLCADLLRYGAKSQIFKGYAPDRLADANMTEEQKTYLSSIENVTFGDTNRLLEDLEHATVTWVGKALDLESKVSLKLIFSPGDYAEVTEGLTLRVRYADTKGAEKTLILSNPEQYNEAMGYYAFTVDTLLAAELRSVISAQIYDGETPVSCTLQYSADTYGNNKTGALLDVCKALFAYSDSAKAYFVN